MVVNARKLFKIPQENTVGRIRPYIPSGPLKLHIVTNMHAGLSYGHLGMNKTIKAISDRFFWENLRDDVEKYIHQCPCNLNKVQNTTNRGELEPTIIGYPWRDVHLDYIGPINIHNDPQKDPESHYILVMVDRFAKLVELAHTSNTTAETTLRKFLKRIVTRFGTPQTVTVDVAGSFKEQFTQGLYVCGIEKLQILPYQNNSNGQVERMNRTIEEIIRSYSNERKIQFKELLPWVQCAMNTSHTRSHKN